MTSKNKIQKYFSVKNMIFSDFEWFLGNLGWKPIVLTFISNHYHTCQVQYEGTKKSEIFQNHQKFI